MKTKRIKNVRIHIADKKAPIPIQDAINKIHVRWIERTLDKSGYPPKTKIMIINAIITKMHI